MPSSAPERTVVSSGTPHPFPVDTWTPDLPRQVPPRSDGPELPPRPPSDPEVRAGEAFSFSKLIWDAFAKPSYGDLLIHFGVLCQVVPSRHDLDLKQWPPVLVGSGCLVASPRQALTCHRPGGWQPGIRVPSWRGP